MGYASIWLSPELLSRQPYIDRITGWQSQQRKFVTSWLWGLGKLFFLFNAWLRLQTMHYIPSIIWLISGKSTLVQAVVWRQFDITFSIELMITRHSEIIWLSVHNNLKFIASTVLNTIQVLDHDLTKQWACHIQWLLSGPPYLHPLTSTQPPHPTLRLRTHR